MSGTNQFAGRHVGVETHSCLIERVGENYNVESIQPCKVWNRHIFTSAGEVSDFLTMFFEYRPPSGSHVAVEGQISQ